MKKMLSMLLVLALALSLCAIASAEEPVHLIWWVFANSEAPTDWAEVEEALNAYSAEKIGVTCEFKYLTAEQIARSMQTGEPFDIAFTCDWYNDFATNASTGMFLDLTDIINEYAPELVASMPENIWGGSYYNGRLYAIPHMKDYGLEIFWILDTDYYLNQKGLEADHYISFEGI